MYVMNYVTYVMYIMYVLIHKYDVCCTLWVLQIFLLLVGSLAGWICFPKED